MSIKIYTMTHKKFYEPENQIYLPLHVGRATSQELGYLGDNTGENISSLNKYYGELTGVYWVWKNEKEADYIGICHYRRFFVNEERNLLQEADYEAILKDYDVIVSKAMQAEGAYLDYYGEAHNKEDLLTVGRAIEKLYPQDYPLFEQVMHQSKYYYGNLMVTSRELFDAYASWLFSVFAEVEDKIDVSSYDLYNQRVFGFLSEQLLLVWITKMGLKVYECPIGITAEKAETVELKLAMKQLVKLGEIHQAREMFYEFLKLRPDVQLELSDVKKELPMIEQILYIMQEEAAVDTNELRTYSSNLDELLEHFRSVTNMLKQYAAAEDFEVIKSCEDYLEKTAVSGIMIATIILNGDFSIEEKRAVKEKTKDLFVRLKKTSNAEVIAHLNL